MKANYKQAVKAGQMQPEEALRQMKQNQTSDKSDVTKSDTYRWIQKRCK